MDGLVSLHLIALSAWAGVVAVEIVLELGGRRGELAPEVVAGLHWRIDRFVELPLLVLVLATGGLLWARTGFSAALLGKVGFGAGAVLSNLVCVGVVRARARAPEARRLSDAVAATALVGVPLAMVALGLGGARAGWW